MKTPLVSIIIPTYNRAHLIGETLDSILAQTYANWECIVVDDGSTDKTSELMAAYCKKDMRFQYHHRPKDRPKGANACRNYGFELSKGEYIQYLDSDDLISLNKIEEQVISIINEKRNSVATCKWGGFRNNISDLVIKNNEPYYFSYHTGLDLLNEMGKNGGYFPSHVYLVKREIIKTTGGWDELLEINQDGEYFCRVLLNCDKIIFVKNAIVYYRSNTSNNTSLTNSSKRMLDRIDSWKTINNHIIKRHNINNSKYVRNAKENIFKVLLKEYPDLLQ